MQKELIQVAATIGQTAGAAIFAYAAVYVGILGNKPMSPRAWGPARSLNRRTFAICFGTVGLALSLACYLIFLNIESELPIAALALLAIFATLLVGWLIMRARTTQQRTRGD